MRVVALNERKKGKCTDQGLENQGYTSGDECSRSRNEYNDKSTSEDDTYIRPSYDIESMVEVPYTIEYNVFAIETQHFEQHEFMNDTHVMEKDDSNIIPDSSNMYDNDNQANQNVEVCDDERVVLANLKLDIDENKKIQKQLKKTNASPTQELKDCKYTLKVTNRNLGESNRTRDSFLIALQNKQTKLKRYKAFNDRTIDYDKLKRKLNETLGLLAQKEIDIKEVLKIKAYEISFVKEKHNELVKQSFLTKSLYEDLVKEKTKTNFCKSNVPQEAQSEKLCLYEIPYDTSDLVNRFVPDREETLTLEKESRSKWNKDIVKPCDYTKQNSLYEILKPATHKYHEQLAHANETQNDSFKIVHELKHEMHADLKYVESLEKEIDEHEFDKAETSNMYDIILHQFASQVGMSYDLTKPFTSHSWPQVRKLSFAKPYDVNSPGPSRNSPPDVSFQSPRESVSSNDMVHNYYLAEAKKKAQL
nr:hypothetical protein [Tanacetum cinerariifolium]